MELNLDPVLLTDCAENLTEFTQSFIDTHNCLESICVVLDKNNNIVALTNKFKDNYVIDSTENLIGGALNNSKFALLAKFNPLVAKLDEATTNMQERVIYLNIVKNSLHTDMFIVHKTPVFSKFNHAFLCNVLTIRPFKVLRVVSLVVKFRNLKNMLPDMSTTIPNIKLSNKQQMVLYLYARSLSYTEIAKFLSDIGFKMSPSRVNEHLERLKDILGAPGKEQLLDIAVKLNYDIAFPIDFLVEGAYEITHDVFDHWVVS